MMIGALLYAKHSRRVDRVNLTYGICPRLSPAGPPARRARAPRPSCASMHAALPTEAPPQVFADVSSITSCEANDRAAKQSDTGSDTWEHSMLLMTTPAHAPWLLHRHRYVEECSRLTGRLALCALLAALALFTAGLVNVTEAAHRRGDLPHRLGLGLGLRLGLG